MQPAGKKKEEDRRMQIVVSPAVRAKIERIARAKKTKPQKIVLDALTYYLPLVDPDLETEFAEWDRLSDEALIDFEKRLS